MRMAKSPLGLVLIPAVVVVLVAVGILVIRPVTGAASTGPAPGTDNPCGRPTAPPTTYDHVIWIWYENASLTDIIGNADAPNINRLATQCSLARNFTGIDHPSATDYVAATSGAVHAGQGDCLPAQCPDPDRSLFEQVKSWKTYNGGQVRPCEGDYGGDHFDANHNPAAYYTRIAADCAKYAVALGSPTAGPLVDDLANDTLPQFVFIAPDLLHDMHDGSVADGDAYLGSLMTVIVS